MNDALRSIHTITGVKSSDGTFAVTATSSALAQAKYDEYVADRRVSGEYKYTGVIWYGNGRVQKFISLKGHIDTDGGGVSDSDEAVAGTNPTNAADD